MTLKLWMLKALMQASKMQNRIEFVKSRETEKAGIDKLPADALEALENVVKQANL